MKNPFNWLLESNRVSHLFCGAVIYFAFLVAYAVMLAVSGVQLDVLTEGKMLVIVSALALLCVFLCMCSVEYIQSKFKVKADVLDILAGCLVPIVIFVFISVLTMLDAV